jgi:putative ABC transport system permease protein
MWKATVKGILARRVRLGLTALAVLLGVSFVSGTYVLTDTLDRSFRGLFRESVAGVDLVVRQRAPFGGDTGRDRFSDAVIAEIRGVPGVAAAAGYLQGNAQFVDRNGRAIQTGGAPTLGITWAQQDGHGPLHLVADRRRRGRAPNGRHEVAMDAGTAREHGFHVGDTVRVLLEGPAEQFRIVGLFGLGTRQDFGAVTFAAFDLTTAQEVFAARRSVDAVNVTAASGVDVRDLRARIAAKIGPAYDVQTAGEIATDRGKQVIDFLSLLTQLLLGFAAIGLVIGAFIIFNTFAILLTQRTRELGLLRAMGASGRQVVVSVLVEATVLGAVASAVGVALGVGLVAGLLSALDALGRNVPQGGVVLTERTVIAAIAVGVTVTVASALWPAIRAARIPPVAAINDEVSTPVRSFRWRVLFGALLIAGGVPALVVGLDKTRNAPNVVDEIWLVALGALLVLFGAIVLLAAFARPLSGLLGRPLRAVDVAGALARGNAMRNPRRTAATASALVIGLSLVGLVAIFGDSAKASVNDAIDHGIRADFVLKAKQFAGFSSQVAERLRKLPELRAVASFRFGNMRVNEKEETVAGVEGRELGPVVALRLSAGSTAALGKDGVLVYRDAAKEYHVGVGDHLTVQFPRGFTTLRVAGIYRQEDFTGGFPVPFIVAKAAYDRGFTSTEQDKLVYVRARGDLTAARAAIETTIARAFPNIEIFTRREYRDDQAQAIDRFLTVVVALLLLSQIIAVLGIVNTLALSAYERTRELGLLRSIGMSRRQLRRMVREESVIIAVVGGLVGTAIGLLWGWVFTAALKSQGITVFSIPGGQLAGFVVLSMLAGVAAALAPAWRASRLDVLTAIATE